ncbi:glycoside hydrolase family 15 protein [Leptospira sp. 201903071]|uniref:glycoside hydrolase family 15 protein n=1 Tax=Leptospira ainazelensis TaxID=2810034 RepID=UPI0019657069|nr:glycoside hydrolase family 15 protein [Leptospira ainazelensis]MBM9501503.1 glycoside hydrolase family 15 protein [Leptospira ainazelensis]
MPKHTYPFGIVGNCSYLALINQNTNVEWLCWPRFDSSFIFGSLLDEKKGGKFKVETAEPNPKFNQRYEENTNIIATRIEAKDGVFEVTDFAPRFSEYERHYKPLMFVRKIRPISGSPNIRILCNPTGNYGEYSPKTNIGSNHLLFTGLGSDVRLTTNVSLNYIIQESSFVLNEEKYLVLTYGEPFEAPLEKTVDELYNRTRKYWRNWVKHCGIGEFEQSFVIRSALTLKLHQYQDTGAIIASSTTSLPEHPGGERNWDYRYCWIRDAYYTLTALNNIAHFEEMEMYSHFLENIATKNSGRIQPLFSIGGEEKIEEKIIGLNGYMGNLPVRVGNQAYTHIQNDVYGQILLSLVPLYIDRRFHTEDKSTSRTLIFQLLKHLERTMDEPDAGLWEFRNTKQKHCYTFLFHWAGSSAAIKIGESLHDREICDLAKKLKREAEIRIEKCYDPIRKVYTQAEGVASLDASLLQLISMGYLDPSSQKTKDHLSALESELKTKDGLFYRYKHSDDFGEPKTSFLVCAFWYVDALACIGRIEEAKVYFKNLTRFTNHLGLFSEDVDPEDGSQWGNFPQTYSHVGLMNSAFRISRKLDIPLWKESGF